MNQAEVDWWWATISRLWTLSLEAWRSIRSRYDSSSRRRAFRRCLWSFRKPTGLGWDGGDWNETRKLLTPGCWPNFFGGKHEAHGDGTFTERNYYQGGLGGSDRLWKDACLNQRIMEISQWGGRLAGELSRSFASLSRCWNVVPKGLHSQRIAPGDLQTIEAAPANWWLHYAWWVTLLEDMWNWSRWMLKFNLRSLWGKESQLWCLISLLFRGIPWGMAWPPRLRTGSTKYVSTTSILAIKSWCFLDGNRMAIPTWASYWVEHRIFWRLWAILRGTTSYDEQWNQMKCWLKKKHASNHRPWWMAYWYLVFGVYLCNVWARYSPNLVLSISRGSWIWFNPQDRQLALLVPRWWKANTILLRLKILNCCGRQFPLQIFTQTRMIIPSGKLTLTLKIA